MEEILAVQHISKQFSGRGVPAVSAVRDVSFSVYAGETVGLIGASGCGKSTLARIIMGLEQADAGTILFKGEDMTGIRGKKLRAFYQQAQMIFQMPVSAFDPRRTLGSSLSEGLRNRGMRTADAREKVRMLLCQCGLEPSVAEAYPRDVSGGQCQRAAIARALAMEPEFLLCDEVTSSLDMITQAQIMQLLKRLQREQHMACLFITHNLALAQQCCRRLLVMKDGEIVESGKTEKVICHPQHAYTRQLLDAVI